MQQHRHVSKLQSHFPQNPTLRRAKLMDNEHFRLNSNELSNIHRHLHPFMKSPYDEDHNGDKIQKRKKSHVHETKFGRQQGHHAALYHRPIMH